MGAQERQTAGSGQAHQVARTFPKPMTKLNWTRTKRERSVPKRASWKSRSVAEIEQDLKVISDAWEGTALDRQAWGILKRELKVAKLEAERVANKKGNSP